MTSSAAAAESIQRQSAEKAKHEHAVVARINELRRQGLWSAQRLPRAQEPPRPKCHWDFLLEEARWLYSDYRSERKWKREKARKLAHAAFKHINNKRTQQERLEKEKLQNIRKVASCVAKEVRKFWSEIENVVTLKQNTKLEEARLRGRNLHLNYMLDQADKLTDDPVGKPQTQPQDHQLATPDQPVNNYLIKQEESSENLDTREPVINVSNLTFLSLAPLNATLDSLIDRECQFLHEPKLTTSPKHPDSQWKGTPELRYNLSIDFNYLF